MARVYQSRGLIDPTMYQLMSNNMNERIRQDRESRRPVVEMLQGAVTTLGSAYDDWSKQKGRDRYLKRVMEENPEFAEYAKNPFFKAGMHEFVRTGSASPLMSFLGQENTRKIAEQAAEQRAYESEQRYLDSLERQNREDKLKRANAEAEVEGLRQKAAAAANEGKYAEAEMYDKQAWLKAKGNGIDAGSGEYLEAIKKENEAKTASMNNRIYLEGQLNSKDITTDDDLQKYKQNIRAWHDDGKINDADYKKLLDSADSFKTEETKNRESAQDTGRGIRKKRTEHNAEEKDKADAAWAKLKEGYTIFGDEESVFLKVYGEDKDKMAKYHAVND